MVFFCRIFFETGKLIVHRIFCYFRMNRIHMDISQTIPEILFCFHTFTAEPILKYMSVTIVFYNCNILQILPRHWP